MKINLKTPIVIEDKVYEYAHVSLSTTTGFSNPEEYTLAIRLTPYRVLQDGKIEKIEESIISYSFLSALNSPLSEEFKEIITVIQKIVNK